MQAVVYVSLVYHLVLAGKLTLFIAAARVCLQSLMGRKVYVRFSTKLDPTPRRPVVPAARRREVGDNGQ